MKIGRFLNRSTEALWALAAFVLLATPTWPSLPPPAPGPATSWLRAEPVLLSAERPGLSETGALDYLGGWVLTAGDARFGGISALQVAGEEALAISDAGDLLRFALPGSARFGAVRVSRLQQGPMPARRKSDRDAEAMIFSGRQAWVVWEWRREIWRYDRRTARATAASRPAAMRSLRRSAGAEAMVRLGNGRFLLLAETPAPQAGLSRAILFGGDPAVPGTAAAQLFYRAPAGFRATDAALLPDGRVLVLNRRADILEGIGAALVVIDPATMRPGTVLEGRELARLEWPMVVDNMEALSVSREGGRTIIWLASDDNFSPLQRTLLLRFALRETQ